MMKTYAVILSIAAVLAIGAPTSAQTTDVTGKWDVSINTGQETIPAFLTLEKKGDKIAGGIKDGRAPDKGEAPVQATIDANKITISFDYTDASNGPMHIVMNGNIEKETMGGTITFGEMGQGEWSAKRPGASSKPDDKPATAPAAGNLDVSGTWNATVTTSEFSATPSLVLKQEGEKVTGQYVSAQYGSFPLQGTLKGNALNLSFTMAIEGNSLAVTIAGTADKDGIKGTISYGGFTEGTFAAQKKS
jgi:hypothetical protein